MERRRRRGGARRRRRRCAATGAAGVRPRAAARRSAPLPEQQECGGGRARRPRSPPGHAPAPGALRLVADRLEREVGEPALARLRVGRRPGQLRVRRRQRARMRGGRGPLPRRDRPCAPGLALRDSQLPGWMLGVRPTGGDRRGRATRGALPGGGRAGHASRVVRDLRGVHREPRAGRPHLPGGTGSGSAALPAHAADESVQQHDDPANRGAGGTGARVRRDGGSRRRGQRPLRRLRARGSRALHTPRRLPVGREPAHELSYARTRRRAPAARAARRDRGRPRSRDRRRSLRAHGPERAHAAIPGGSRLRRGQGRELPTRPASSASRLPTPRG